ncbi:MAG: aspartate aminotransferase family protein [Acidobacteria bacterium]|nr:[LysW]-aminoadipate semialdehyde transaminase [Pyrinomonadaceae bacterium]RIJ92437.1 MAG: aspartate aminotransferase family protein [Acidobacteriota bacterium]
MTSEEIFTTEKNFQLSTYSKLELAIVRGSGSWVWTSDNEKYLDLYGGHAVCALGHSHPDVATAISEQAQKLMFYSNVVYSDVRAKAAERLVSVAPIPLSKAFFCNSGTEANENAMRIARLATGRSNIVSFAKGFHGRTADSISATFLGKYRTLGEPNVPGHLEAQFGDLESIASVIDKETAGVLIEPIQSMAGVREASPEFFKQLRAKCDEVGAALIFDEVQTGVGRTGEWFFAGSEAAGGVVPDIVTLAKSLGSGVPVGACLVSDGMAASIKENDLGTTFGGGMIAMAAVNATLDVIARDGLLANAKNIEAWIRDACSHCKAVKAVHGKGCLLGVEFEDRAHPHYQKLLDAKILTGMSSDPSVLRLLPPLNVSEDEIKLFAEVLSA